MKWTVEHEIVTLDLYCRIPFNKANNSNQQIKDLANLLGRSANSVKMKIGNFGSFDPELKRLGIVGLDSTSHLDEEVWHKYYNNWDRLAFDAQQILANLNHRSIELQSGIDTRQLPAGAEREVMVRQRINQSFFRSAVLSSYSERCCITGMGHTTLLEAAHIVPWSADESVRTNPTNGLCLNKLMHAAYDHFLLSISPDYIVHVSDELLEAEKQNERAIALYRQVDGQKIYTPNKFMPNTDSLCQHYEHYCHAK